MSLDQLIIEKQLSRRPFRRLEDELREFHHAAGQVIGRSPAIRHANLRARLITEEALETALALLMEDHSTGVEAGLRLHDIIDGVMKHLVSSGKLNRPDDPVERLAEVIDGMVDLSYVTIGTGVTCGTPLDPFWNEIHASNLAKAGAPIVDGKLMKPRGWRPPQIKAMLESLRPALSEEVGSWRPTENTRRIPNAKED